MKKIKQLTMKDICSLHREFSVSASYIGKSKHYSSFNSIHAFGAKRIIETDANDALEQIEGSLQTDEYHFGCFSFDLKEATEQSLSRNSSKLNVSDVYFFVPENILLEKDNEWFFIGENHSELLQKITSFTPEKQSIQLNPSISKEDYFKQFSIIQDHIQRGDVYEMNYCQEFAQEYADIDPINLFYSIIENVDAPYSSFFQANDLFIISASPERFLRKDDNTLISQPIKGTAKRGTTEEEDLVLKTALSQSKKEKAENVMIVDLVRNDLSKVCKSGSVKVPHFQSIDSYSTVHQMVSTITGEIRDNTSFADIITATFPMGSMTGAPKKKVLEITERLEDFKRGWYSGALGYIEANGNFDFNVLIRTFIYNKEKQYLSYSVGSGITTYANAEEEYNECLLKVESLVDKLS